MTLLKIATWPLLLLLTTPLQAASFAEMMREFVFGAQAKASVGDDDGIGILDDVARECMQCHDGSTARHVSVKSADAPLQFDGLRNANHPVGMSYDEHYRNRPDRYRARALLDPNIKLIGDMVSCVSCHRLKNSASPTSNAPQLTLADSESCAASRELTVPRNLCQACHIY